MKYEDIKLVLMLMFRNLRTTDYDFKMGKNRLELSVRIQRVEKLICDSCEKSIKIYSPYLFSDNVTGNYTFHLNCIEWKNNIKITNKILLDEEKHTEPKWP